MDYNKIKELSSQEMMDALQEEFNKYKEYVDTIMTVEEIAAEEERLVKEEKEPFEEYIKTATYDLAAGASFEGSNYTQEMVFKMIVEFLNKQEVEYQYTLGLYEMNKLFKSNIKKIEYAPLDNTLRVLQSLKYKGEENWRKILIINNYFISAAEKLRKDQKILTFLSYKHNELLQRDTLLKKVPGEKIEPVDMQES